jgi:predicted component of type VI protein secretion system
LLPNQSQATVLLGKSAKTEPEQAYLEYKDPQSLSMTRLMIDTEGLVLGRDSESTPFMRDDRQVSRRHVELLWMDGGLLHLRDLGSKNGTQLNAEALIPLREYPLADGDELTVAEFCFRFVLPT